MKKEVIEFLKKSGYSFEEIMKLDTDTGTDSGTDSGTDTGTGINPSKTSENLSNSDETKKAGTDTPNEKTLAEQLAELRGELKALREITHNENRKQDTIEKPGKKLTFEEDVEKLIEEVNK